MPFQGFQMMANYTLEGEGEGTLLQKLDNSEDVVNKTISNVIVDIQFYQ